MCKNSEPSKSMFRKKLHFKTFPHFYTTFRQPWLSFGINQNLVYNMFSSDSFHCFLSKCCKNAIFCSWEIWQNQYNPLCFGLYADLPYNFGVAYSVGVSGLSPYFVVGSLKIAPPTFLHSPIPVNRLRNKESPLQTSALTSYFHHKASFQK